MLKLKLLLLLSYSIILNHFGETMNSLPQLFAPIIYLGFGNILYQILAVLLIASSIYLAISQLIYPYKNGLSIVYGSMILFIISLIPSFLNLGNYPNDALLKFTISVSIFFIMTVYVFIKMRQIKIDNKD
jgi:hypothetical protein